MRAYIVVGNEAVTEPFNLSDLPGAGRIDILCRCISQAIFLSHAIRKDVEVFLLLLGKPDPPRAIKIVSGELKRMSPDERNIAGHIRKAVSFKAGEEWTETNSGIYTAKKDLRKLLEEVSQRYKVYYMIEDGKDIREILKELKSPAFVLGDHIGLKEKEEKIVLEFAEDLVSVSKLSLMAETCIAIANYELDRA